MCVLFWGVGGWPDPLLEPISEDPAGLFGGGFLAISAEGYWSSDLGFLLPVAQEGST